MIIARMEGISMVLKKPYAFLIKHFKLIHLLLCIPLIYLIIRTGAITSFFSSYVSSNYYTNLTNVSGTYINYFMYFASLLVVLLVLAIYFLMRQKKKNTKFYMFLIIYYIVLFILMSMCHGILSAVEAEEVEAQTVRVYRDLSYIVYIPQFFFLATTLIRGIGFNLKKFNFEEDVKELEITDIDSEEFELTFGKEVYKYKRTARRFIREFKYYVLENKFTFTILSVVIVAIIGTLLYLNFGVYHKTYSQTQRMTHNNLYVSVVDSVLTNMDLGGNIIDEGKYYMAVALKINNNNKNPVTLDYENFKLEVANRYIDATLDRATYFADMGLPYARNTLINPKEENVYVLTYEIDESLLDYQISLKILESLNYEVGSVTSIYKTVNLKYEKIFENKVDKTLELKKILELSNTRLGMVQVQIQEYLIQNSYEYNYKNCMLNNCQNLKNKIVANQNKTLLILNRFFQMDTYTNYYIARKGESSFVKDFLKIRYTINDKRKTISLKDSTPKELQDIWVFEVPNEVEHATSLELVVNLRGSLYIIQIF